MLILSWKLDSYAVVISYGYQENKKMTDLPTLFKNLSEFGNKTSFRPHDHEIAVVMKHCN